jgi:hypothetical protein
MTTPLTTLTKHIFKGKSTIYNFKTFQPSGLLFKLSLQKSTKSTKILLRTGFAAVLIITLHTAALWSAQENAEF